MADPIITVTGNLTADPTVNFTASGVAVANLTIASNHRVKDGDQWKDGATTFYRATVWREYAEHVAESLTKGMQVIAQGRLYSEEYTSKEGEQRTSLTLAVDEIGPSLRFATARVTKAQRGNGGGTSNGNAGWGGQQSQAQQSDPWQGQQATAGDWGASTPAGGPPPF